MPPARAVFQAECEAMLAADSVSLGALLAPAFTLTHMTGYVQPRDAWLGDVSARHMEYHSMEVLETLVETADGGPVLSAWTLTHATIWGMRGTWRLLLKNYFREVDGEWLITRTVASTW